jgi:hypothetical protein
MKSTKKEVPLTLIISLVGSVLLFLELIFFKQAIGGTVLAIVVLMFSQLFSLKD